MRRSRSGTLRDRVARAWGAGIVDPFTSLDISRLQCAICPARQGVVVIVAATANRRSYRARARERAARYIEVHVDTPVEECARRDTKGLYRARPDNLPGVDAPFEKPENPDVVAHGGHDDRAVEAIIAILSGQ